MIQLTKIKVGNYMNQDQMDRIHTEKGFIAALDQSGGSTPNALLQYGISKDCYSNDEEMLNLVHKINENAYYYEPCIQFGEHFGCHII